MDLLCLGCQASISSIQAGNVYACFHLLCAACGSDQSCRLDGSCSVMHDSEVVQSICAMQEICRKLQSSGSQDWNLYFSAVYNLQQFVRGKYPLKCQNGHNYTGENCSKCMETLSAPSLLQWLPNFCPNCKVTISGTCLTCNYKDLSAVLTVKEEEEEVQPRNCSRCGQRSQAEVCWQCQQQAFLAPSQPPQFQDPAPVASQSPHWKCSNCNYKYCLQRLTQCPSCYQSKA